MRRFILLFLLSAFLPVIGEAANARILKVLPQYLDSKGRSSLAPSLYERDAYQAQLRTHAERRSGLRFVVQWKGQSINLDNAKIRIEMRGVKGNAIQNRTLEAPATKDGWFSNWTTLTFTGEDYKSFGELISWRATLIESGKEIAEQKSFLW